MGPLFLTLLLVGSVLAQNTCDLSQRTDCGYYGINQSECEVTRACCWSPVQELGQPEDTPWCFYLVAAPAVYNLDSISETTHGYQAFIVINDSSAPQVERLQVDIIFESADRFHLKITDPNTTRWEIPESILPTPGVDPNVGNLNYKFSYTKTPATFAITRLSDGAVIFNASDIHFEDTYLSISTNLDMASGPNVYGLGEHVDPFKLNTASHSYTMWTADVPTPVDQNLYGSHPFFLELRKGGNAHGVYLRNSNGMDVFLNPDQAIFKVNGGILDVYVLAGPTPTAVVQQFHLVIGTPYIPPYWSLGWHQCRYGYANLNVTKAVVANYATAGIPLETIWNDIDYMQAYEDFTWDSVNYPQDQVRAFADQLHSNNQHYVTIVDPGIHVRQGYPAYDSGISQGVFLMKSDGVTPFVGQVWPGQTTFPDFFNPKTQSWWESQFQPWLAGVPVDGIWIDMNEISNFQNGDEKPIYARLGDVNNPTYKINNFNSHASLNSKTTAMDCKHSGGILEYNTHNLFGFTESMATHNMLISIYKKRPFVLTRSSYSGSGKWTAHWLGDNHSTWESLAESIPGILNFGLFGVPFVGADICGFIGDTTEELCARWSALGAFYPFSRNHNDKGSGTNQEPYNWPSVTQVAIKTLNARYSLLNYYYTLFYQASVSGGQVAQALLFTFPTDANTYAIDKQFMIGSAILVSPVLQQGATSVQAYFPDANWYSFWDGTPLKGAPGIAILTATLTDIPVHVKGGSVLVLQKPANTIFQTRANPFNLLVALDKDNSGTGSVFLDDGETVDGPFSLITYQASKGTVASTIVKSDYTTAPNLDAVKVLGLSSVTTVTVNGAAWSTFTFNCSTSSLSITGFSLSMVKAFTVTWA